MRRLGRLGPAWGQLGAILGPSWSEEPMDDANPVPPVTLAKTLLGFFLKGNV